MYKIFPGYFTNDNRKVPLIKWTIESSNDPNIIKHWQDTLLKGNNFWGVPCGAENGIIVLDVDVKGGGLETIKNYHVPLTQTQVTRSGGIHHIFKYPNDGKIYGNRVGFDNGLDIRGEAGYITYYGVDSTPIAEAPEWLLTQALNEEIKEIDYSKIVKVSPEIVNAILNEACENIRQAPPSESNDVLNKESYKVGQLLASGSVERDRAYCELFEAAKDRGKNEREAEATINSGLKGGTKSPLTSPFDNIAPILTIPETEEPTPDDWTPAFCSVAELSDFTSLKKPQLFKNWSTEDIHITTADGGTGKTTLKLFEAVALALGESFLGFECLSPGRTLFITGEDTRKKIYSMLAHILREMKITKSSNFEKWDKVRNSILVKKADDICLITKTKHGFIDINPDALNKVLGAVKNLRPKLIVFDPISSFWGSESALNDMSKAVAKFMGIIAEESNACVEVINHMGKASSSTKDMTQFAGRGGSALPSHARVSRVLRPIFGDEYQELTGMTLDENRSAMLCNVNKFSDGSPLYNNPFLIIRDGFLFSKLDLVEQKVKEEQNKMSDASRVFMFINNERAEGRYPTKSIIIGKFIAASDKLSKERTIRALDSLSYSGHMGEKIKSIHNPNDPESKDNVFIITDMDGKES